MAAASILAAGCGGNDEEDVKTAIKDVAQAAKDKDYDKVCDLLTSEVIKQIEAGGSGEGPSCAELFKQVDQGGALSKEIGDPEDIEFDTVTIDGDRATVKIKDDPEAAELEKEDGEWKVGVGP